MSWLIEDGLLRLVTNAVQPEWVIPGNEDEPNPLRFFKEALKR
jgi:hypothetical protein